jgi:hypothetical protein
MERRFADSLGYVISSGSISINAEDVRMRKELVVALLMETFHLLFFTKWLRKTMKYRTTFCMLRLNLERLASCRLKHTVT